MHPLLARQIRRHLPTATSSPELAGLLKAVESAYLDAESERKLLENALELSSKELKERFEQLQRDTADRLRVTRERDTFFRVSTDLLCIIRPDVTFSHVNPIWHEVFGYTVHELVGRSVLDYVHPDDLVRTQVEARAVIKGGRSSGFEMRYRTKTGGYRMLSWTAVVDPETNMIYAVARDITEHRKLEAELAQAHKLEAVGQLASGVAHEINTPIQFVGDNVQFALDSFDELLALFPMLEKLHDGAKKGDIDALRDACGDLDLDYLAVEIPKSLKDAKDGVKHVAELVRALKEFAHTDEPDLVEADIQQALERTIILAKGEVKHIADIQTRFDPLPPVQCQVGALNQVFLNLIVNAAHAIEDKNTRHNTPDRRGTIEVSVHVDVSPDGDRVVIAVRDSGCGMPEAVQQRLFEPFFTTKEMGRGSGQGLPFIRKVIERHRGQIRFETAVDVGTTFFVSLPVRQASDHPIDNAVAPPADATVGGAP